MRTRPTPNEIEQHLNSFPKLMHKYKDRDEEAERNIKEFIEDFPIDEINKLTVEDYARSPLPYGDSNSFCNRLYKIGNSSMKQCWDYFFGVHYKKGVGFTAPDSLLKIHTNVNGVLQWQLNEIIELIKAGDRHDVSSIANSKINSYVKAKILSVYFPNDYLPMNSNPYVENVLNALNIAYEKTEDIIIKTEKLRAWKNSHSQSKNWSNIVFMHFCDEYYKRLDDDNDNYPQPSTNAIEYNVFELSKEERKIKEQLLKDAEEAEKRRYNIPEFTNPISETERESVVKERIGQGQFRDGLLKAYGHKCMICGLNIKSLLRASHIKAWKDSDNRERLDVNNGLLLCTTHDSLFDSHLISFDCNRKILISKKISNDNKKLLNINDVIRIEYGEKTDKYMQYHRDIFNSLNT